jgi:hypothetical protein
LDGKVCQRETLLTYYEILLMTAVKFFTEQAPGFKVSSLLQLNFNFRPLNFSFEIAGSRVGTSHYQR